MLSGARTCTYNQSCRSRQELSNAYLLAKFGFDTAENEPCKVCRRAVTAQRWSPSMMAQRPMALPVFRSFHLASNAGLFAGCLPKWQLLAEVAERKTSCWFSFLAKKRKTSSELSVASCAATTNAATSRRSRHPAQKQPPGKCVFAVSCVCECHDSKEALLGNEFQTATLPIVFCKEIGPAGNLCCVAPQSLGSGAQITSVSRCCCRYCCC